MEKKYALLQDFSRLNRKHVTTGQHLHGCVKCHRCAIFHSSTNPKVLKGFQTQGCNIFNKFNLFYTEKNTKLLFLRQNAGNNFYEFKQSPRPCQLHEDCYRTPFYLHAEAEPVHRLLYCGFVPQAECLDPVGSDETADKD